MSTAAVAEGSWGFMTPYLYPIIMAMGVLSAFYIWDQRRKFTQLGNKIPGPAPIPLIGNALMVIGKSNHELVLKALELGKMFGNVVRIWLGLNLIVFLTDPDDVEIILNSYEHLEKADEYRFFKPWLGDGLLISSGDRWKSHRKLIAPAFHINVLKSFVSVFNKNSLKVCEKFKSEVGKVFDVHDHMSEITVDILLETAMGTKKTSQGGDGYDYAMAVMKMCDIIHQRHFKLFYRYDTLFNLTGLKETQKKLLGIIHGLTTKVIKEKNEIYSENLKKGNVPSPSLQEIITMENYETSEPTTPKTILKHQGLRDDLDDIDENDVGEKRRLAFLDLMIETKHSGEFINDHDIKEEVDTIMFEGHDTTAAGSSFVLCLLGIHQDIQKKVYDEQFTIFGKSDRPATFADTLEMKYLERVILETLRMYPPVPIIARKVNVDVKLKSSDYSIPAGCTVVVGTLKMHRRPDLFPNPEVFNPDNFLPEKAAARHYYSFIPFSAGPRSCVGRKYAMLKLKILLSTIIRNYRMKSSLKESDFKLQADIILKRQDGFRLEVEPRN